MQTPDQSARVATAHADYLGVGPFGEIGAQPPEYYAELQAACSDIELSPEQTLVDTSISLEHAIALCRKTAIDGSDCKGALDLLREARERCDDVLYSPNVQVTSLERSQAAIMAGSLVVWRTLLSGNHDTIGFSIQSYLHAQGVAAQHALDHYHKTNGSARATVAASYLTAVMLLSYKACQDTGYVPLPAPYRAWQSQVDTASNWGAGILTISDMSFVPLRIAASRGYRDDCIEIPPFMLDSEGNNRSQRPLGYKTLVDLVAQQTILDRRAELLSGRMSAAEVETARKTLDFTQRRTSVTAQALRQEVESQLPDCQQGSIAAQNEAQEPDEWYKRLHPQQNSCTTGGRQRLDQLIAQLEMPFVDGSCSTEDARNLGYLHADYGLGTALDPLGDRQSAAASLERAQDVLQWAIEHPDQDTNTPEYLEMCLVRAALPVYAAIVRQSSEDIEPIMQQYRTNLFDLSRRVLNLFDRLPAAHGHRLPLDNLLQRLTAHCLLAGEEAGLAYAPLPALPRQRKNGGWDITAFSSTITGFEVASFGRIRVADGVDYALLAEGISTLTPDQLQQKNRKHRAATLRALLAGLSNKQTTKAFANALDVVAASEV